MDRIEKAKPKRPSHYANEGEVSAADQPLLETVTGRAPDAQAAAEGDPIASEFASEIDRPLGGRPRSEITGRHDPGSDANETVDGLSPTEEALREAAEDVPLGGPEATEDELPVFDRAEEAPEM